MAYLMQFLIILGFSLAGEALHAFLPLPIPAAIYGLFLLLLALMTDIVKPRHIKEIAGWLIAIMPVLFVAPAVNLMGCWALVAPHLLPVLVIVAVSTLLTFAAAGKATDLFCGRGKEDG